MSSAATGSGVQPAVSAGQPLEQPSTVADPATPRIDLIETPDDIVILAELPGYEKDDIVLEALDQQVRIFAEREEDDLEEGQPHVRERLLRVERTVFLPAAVDIEDADASFEKGICRIEIPKIEESRAHRIGFH
ncbi:Hsp20/alpha crystallin family protein [Halorubrum trueperi]|uniref:Hsp20/alpha crystallin family protein n=1 Tax=Halorubrum trueperi TaxID=2004704 RepID=A0ABD5UMJ3_9EURY